MSLFNNAKHLGQIFIGRFSSFGYLALECFSINNPCSRILKCTFKMSILSAYLHEEQIWLFLFNLHAPTFSHLKKNKSIAYHKYADTTEMYIYLSTGHSGPNVTLIKCIEHVNAWICHYYLCVNLISLSLKLKL